MDALKIKLRNWVAKVRFSKLIRHFNRNASPFEDNTDFLKATLTLLNISRKGRNFVEIILLATELLSIQNPDTPGGLYHFIDAIALPKPSSLLQLNDRMIGLCQKHPKNEVQAERRAMCALVWSILATKLAGRLSAQLLNNQVVDILFDSIRPHHANLTQIFSLIAIQSFMTTRENKVRLLAAGLPGLLSSIIHESSVNLSAEKRMEADRRRLHLLRSVLDRRING
ncbi:hypothetical protein L0F63_002720 [Massospora cicadina]|nr:hypothetical protein L0F63_002720 [Massospora cicadina]